MKAFKIIDSKEYELSVVQDNIANTLAPILKLEILDGLPLKNISIVAGSNKFDHRLNRIPLGWFITDKNANIDMWRVTWDSRTITLQATGSGTINLWIY